jgi:multiple sugar transport system permease protein
MILLAVILIPICWNVAMSLDETVTIVIPKPPRLIPKVLSLRNYQYAFRSIPLMRYCLNTLFLVVVNTFISVAASMMCGYAFAKGKFSLKKFWFVFMLAVMMIPFETIMIPLYLKYVQWGMISTYYPLIFGSFSYAYGTFLAKQNIQALPDSLREATFIDGGSEWRTFVSVIIPLSGPVIATLGILQIIRHWNDFLWPMIILQKPSLYTISIGVSLFNSTENVTYFGPRMAVATLSAIPLVTMYLFLQKYIVASVALSGIKQ